MPSSQIFSLFSEWKSEFDDALTKNDTLCIALFSADKKLIYANQAISTFFVGEPNESLINPTFNKILSLDNTVPLIFDGFLTIGDFSLVNNTSILVQIYRKKDNFLIIGGVNSAQLIEQNATMHQLNHEISNLQGKLIKEKNNLEYTFDLLKETNKELNQINAEKDKFFSIIAHDLKSPFNAIIGFSDLIVSQIHKNNLEKINEYASIIQQSSQRAMELLMNLMEWSQSQTGRMNYNPVNFELLGLIDEAVLLSNDSAVQKLITIDKNLPVSLIVCADKAMIGTIFRNLISNAIKFTKSGGNISISASANQNEVTISVKDTGVGISETRIEKLFHLDESYSTTGTNNEKGTGLGLILCKEFVEKHNKKIWVESEEGVGSTFYFTIPVPVKLGKKSNSDDAALNTALKNLKILIVEDDETSQILISIIVKSFCRELLIANNGDEAVEICSNNPDIDLILMDIQMPETNGYEATQKIREFNKEVVIIAQSAYGLVNEREKSIDAGCNDFIAKPIKREELIALILKYFNK
ncbi:MAG TPA: hybrid sensor histidine kinase/response regulator [Lutibacter sp.]|nr:hybrid sensor histidine kinase/response regulator [Lutibacter sp.]